MGKIEKIKRYIERTAMPQSERIKYDMLCSELIALTKLPQMCDAVGLAFEYGRSKGYRAGIADTRRKGGREYE